MVWRDTFAAQQGHFMTRTEYPLDFAGCSVLVEVTCIEASLYEAGDYFVKAEWNEFLPRKHFTSNCQQAQCFR
jgi:hypothetical protein